jgi:phage terminase large subunit GpA-like protein
MTDAKTERVTWMKSARIGATLTLGAASGYFAHHEPSPQFFVLPTVALAEKYSTGYYTPMIAACEVLRETFGDPTVKKPGQTILERKYAGGPVRFVGSNSGAGFRMVQARVICMDEVSAFSATAGDSGDPVSLAENRGLDFWDRKIIAISTPKNEGTCRVTSRFMEGDQRRYHVPCPHCGHANYLVFSKRAEGTQHYMHWPEGEPEKAHFVCGLKGCTIEESHKESIVAAGKFVAAMEFDGHASFHV